MLKLKSVQSYSGLWYLYSHKINTTDNTLQSSQSDDTIAQYVKTGGAGKSRGKVLSRSLKLVSPWEWEELSSKYDGFRVFTIHVYVFFLWIFLSFGAGAETFLDSSGAGSSSEQNVLMAPAPASMHKCISEFHKCNLPWIRSWTCKGHT